MKLDKFTEKAQEALQGAAELARDRGQQAVEPEHLLLALVREEEGSRDPCSRGPASRCRHSSRRSSPSVERFPKVSGGGQPYHQPRSEQGARAGRAGGRATQGRVHLDRAPAARPGRQQGLEGCGRDARRAAEGAAPDPRQPARHRSEPGVQVPGAGEIRPRPDQARPQGKLDPVIGRDEEIRRVIQVLSRRTKNNPVLIGEPGVGKTAIAEGLAQRIARATCPRASRASV